MLLVMDVAYPLVLPLFTLALSTISSKINIGSGSCFFSVTVVVSGVIEEDEEASCACGSTVDNEEMVEIVSTYASVSARVSWKVVVGATSVVSFPTCSGASELFDTAVSTNAAM